MDYNFSIFEVIQTLLGMNLPFEQTTEYQKEHQDIKDYRFLVDGKKDSLVFESYIQVFEDKHGFLSNLSILDLLFNEGRYALDYLRNQNL